MRRRSNLMVLLGLAFFVVGAAIVFIVVRDDGGDEASAPDTVQVLVAKEDLAQGAVGEEILDKVEVRNINVNRKLVDALSSPGQLSNQLLTRAFTQGEQIVQSGLRARSLLTQSVEIPEGFEALAVTTAFTSGGAGYVAPGDLINLYTVVNAVPATTGVDGEVTVAPYTAPRAELLLTNVRVLDVQTEVAPFRGSTAPDGTTPAAARNTAIGSLTVLIAVKPIDTEKVIFATSVAELYVARVGDENPPVDATPGRDYNTILEEEPGVAYQRSGPA